MEQFRMGRRAAAAFLSISFVMASSVAASELNGGQSASWAVTTEIAAPPPRKPPPSFPAVLPDRKAAAEPQTVESWSAQEVATAKARCTALLKTIEAVVVAEAPMRQGACGTPAPVQLISLGGNPPVAFSPPPTLTCDMVAALAAWLKNDLQPLARKQLGGPLVRIETMSSYSCRNAYGRARSRLSEHGRANALDIGGFATTSGQATAVLADWGLTNREILAQAAAVAKAESARAEADRATPRTNPAIAGSTDSKAPAVPPVGQPQTPAGNQSVAKSDEPTPARDERTATTSPASGLPARAWGSILEGIPSTAIGLVQGRDGFAYSGMSRLGGPRAAAGKADAGEREATTPAERKERFLKAAHASACRIFGTVLGPEANSAHKNHFHVDMAERSGTRICE